MIHQAQDPNKNNQRERKHPWRLTAAPVLHDGFQGRVWTHFRIGNWLGNLFY